MSLRFGHDILGGPDTPTTPIQEDDNCGPSTPSLRPRRSSKRRRESGSPEDRLPSKMRHRNEGLDRIVDGASSGRSRSLTPPSLRGSPDRLSAPEEARRRSGAGHSGMSPSPPGSSSLLFDAAGVTQLNSRPTKIRELLSHAIHETLRSGGRPDSTSSVRTPLGEQITVQTGGPGEGTNTVEIELKVDDSVPDILIGIFSLSRLLGFFLLGKGC